MNTPPNQPPVKHALGAAWDRLHPVIRRQHDLTPGTDAEVIMTGTLYEIYHSRIAKLFVYPARLFGALVQYRGYDVHTSVRNWTRADDPHHVFWERSFHFPGREPVSFASRMAYLGGNEVAEYVQSGLGMRMRLSVRDGMLMYQGTGYRWDFYSMSVHLPSWLILGRGDICQSGLSDETFSMAFRMCHPLYGRTFAYSGEFRLGAQTRAPQAESQSGSSSV